MKIIMGEIELNCAEMKDCGDQCTCGKYELLFKRRPEDQFAYMILDGMSFTFYSNASKIVKLTVTLRMKPRYYADFELASNGRFELIDSNLSTENQYKAKFLVERNRELLMGGRLKDEWVIKNDL